jgi:hypothetical protein
VPECGEGVGWRAMVVLLLLVQERVGVLFFDMVDGIGILGVDD